MNLKGNFMANDQQQGVFGKCNRFYWFQDTSSWIRPVKLFYIYETDFDKINETLFLVNTISKIKKQKETNITPIDEKKR
jgi:hypothetical protein